MAGAMHKMAVYLGLVEEDRQYDDGYDSYEEEYPGYESRKRPSPAPPPGRRTCWPATRESVLPAWLRRRYRRLTSLVSRPCTRAHTMRLVLSGSTSARAPQ